MITYGYFNSVDGDRVYNADDMSNYFEGIITDGVFKGVGQAFKVVPGSGMQITVGTGKAIVLNKWIKSTAGEALTLVNSDVTLGRYDSVVLRCDLSAREVVLAVKQGTPGESPTPPENTRSSLVYEICLAQIYIGPGVTAIATSAITDTRADENVCGWVQPLVGVTIKKYQRYVTLKADASAVPIGIPEYNSDVDTLLVYVNGLLLNEVEEYMVTGNGAGAYIDLAYTLTAGNECTFIVFKSEAI